MYYSSGNYEAFARPRKPKGVETKTAFFVGSGLASLAGAAFLIRDGHMSGDKITILERLALPGGALDGSGEGWAQNRCGEQNLNPVRQCAQPQRRHKRLATIMDPLLTKESEFTMRLLRTF